ncbi:MAG TPA: hypothetical protein VLM91_23855 [Candidatus Methylomirabilis sp.]|nr:hypothetical protein [Candidatus Methylomirabilis sp.]
MTQRQAGPEEAGPSPDRRLKYLKRGFLLIVGLYGAVCALNPSTPRFLLLNWDQTLGNLASLVGLAALIASVLDGVSFSLEEERDAG